METKNMIMTIVGVAIAVIITAAALMPVLNDAVKTEDKYTNKGFYDMVYDQTAEEITASWDHTNPTFITINDEEIELPAAPPSFGLTVIAGDDWVLRFNLSGSSYGLALWKSSGSPLGANTNDGTDLSLSASNGTATITVTNKTPVTAAYTSLYYASSNGDYVMKNQNERAYVLSDSPIHAIGLSYFGSPINTNIELVFDGTVEDGITGEIYRAGDDATVTDILLDSQTIADHKGLYSIGNITATMTTTGGSADATYSVYIVPATVTAERAVHLDAGEIGILSVVPIMIIIAILMFALSMFIRNRE